MAGICKHDSKQKRAHELLATYLDTSGAYIPGHGTPTVILLGKNQRSSLDPIRTVLGINGEPATPTVPSKGLVWRAICQQITQPGSVSQWVSAADSPRANFHHHPWSIGGGGAVELKEWIENAGAKVLSKSVADIGIGAVTAEDDVFVAPNGVHMRLGVASRSLVAFAEGDIVRNWVVSEPNKAIFPYKRPGLEPVEDYNVVRLLWPQRIGLRNRTWFRKTQDARGLQWWEYGFISKGKLASPRSICWGEVATHNHFVFDRNGMVFKQTAPVIKLKSGSTEADHIRLLGVLNSSTGCFWMRQVCFPKGGDHQGNEGARVRSSLWDERFAFNASQIANFPLPAHQPSRFSTALDVASTDLQSHAPAAVLVDLIPVEGLRVPPGMVTAANSAPQPPRETRFLLPEISPAIPQTISFARAEWHETRRRMISFQEELDWQIYEAFGLLEPSDGLSLPEDQAKDAAVPIDFGQRAFEFVLAERMAAGEEQTTWFERHGAVPQTELPTHWPPEYRARVERRIARIKDDANLRLIERPEYKRRWNTEPWDDQLHRAARDWLLVRLETVFFEGERMRDAGCGMRDAGGGKSVPTASTASAGPDFASAPPPAASGLHPASRIPHPASFPAANEPRLASTRQLADAIAHDADFLRVAAVYRGREDFDLPGLVRTLVEEESVPFLPALRYKEPGLRKRAQWERTWDLQREEDRLDARRAAGETDVPANPDISVPPRYASGDFKKAAFWRLRGKLDVPKERWIVYPGAERAADPAPVIAWAGWDHRQQAQALAGYYQERKDQDGWSPEQLTPLLAGLKDLLPWLKQWHNDLDPVFSLRLGDFYENFVRGETHALGLSDAQVEATRTGEAAG